MIELNIPYRYKRGLYITDMVFISYKQNVYTYMCLETYNQYTIDKNVVNTWMEYMKPLTDEEKLELL